MINDIPSPLLGPKLKKYFKAHTKDLGFSNLHLVTYDFYAFKKVCIKGFIDAVANLVIPMGAIIHAADKYAENTASSNNRKMRASFAIVDSIFTCDTGRSVNTAFSDFDSNFKYRVNRPVIPDCFSTRAGACSGGIHFFLNLKDAFDY